MDNQNNNQPIVNPVSPVNQVSSPVVAPVPPVGAEPQVPQETSSNKKTFIIIGFGVLILAILGVILFYYMFLSKPSSKSASNVQNSVPVATTEEVSKNTEVTSSVTAVKGASDLDQLLNEVNTADNSLDQELVTLGKDSQF